MVGSPGVWKFHTLHASWFHPDYRSVISSVSLLFLFWPHCVPSQFPDQGLNPCALHWECGVLTPGPPWESRKRLLYLFELEVCDARDAGRPWISRRWLAWLSSSLHLLLVEVWMNEEHPAYGGEKEGSFSTEKGSTQPFTFSIFGFCSITLRI